jgi:hypothetical protein
MKDHFASVLCRGAAPALIERTLLPVLRRDGYEPFDEARIPPGYRAERGEFRYVLIGVPDGGRTALLACEWSLGFPLALSLSRLLPDALFVASVRPPIEKLRLKAYRAGDVLLKAGADPDEEIPYHPTLSTGRHLTELLRAWGLSFESGDEAEVVPADVLSRIDPAGFATTPALARTPEPDADDLPFPLRKLVFIRKRSRLFLEA